MLWAQHKSSKSWINHGGSGAIWAALRTSAKEWQWLAPRCRTAAQQWRFSRWEAHGIVMKISYYKYPRLNFTYGVGTRHFVGIAFVPNLSHYKMMVLHLLRVSENNNMILLQNEDWFLSSGCLKGILHHYKRKICFCNQATWSGSSTTNRGLERIGFLS